jgi:hypothetical protein
MQSLQNIKVLKLIEPAAIVDNAAFTTDTIDTAGWDEALFIVQFGAMDIAMAALKLQESDDSGMSGAADVTGGDFSVSPATLPSASADHFLFAVHVKLGGARKRYLDISATGGDGSAGTYASGIVILGKGEASPASTTARGFSQCLYV